MAGDRCLLSVAGMMVAFFGLSSAARAVDGEMTEEVAFQHAFIKQLGLARRARTSPTDTRSGSGSPTSRLILERHGVRLVICAHQHEYQSYAPEGKRTWHELIGAGCDLNDPKGIPGRVPTVIEGKVVDGKLVVVTYDVEHDCTLGKIEFV